MTDLQAWLAQQFPGLTYTLRFADPWTRSDGLTWGRTVTLRPRYEQLLATLDPGAIELLCHELTHVQQFSAWGGWWLLGYLLHHKDWEAAAYQRARELRAMWEGRTT